MPKILIQEIDNSGVSQIASTSNTVYIPCPYTKGYKDTDEGIDVTFNYSDAEFNSLFKPKYFADTISLDVKAEYDDEVSGKSFVYSIYDTSSLSFKLAYHLISLGLPVLLEGVKEEDGVPVINWTRLRDKVLYDIKFLTTGQYGSASNEMLLCAAKRGDCVALLDHPEDIYSLASDKDDSSIVAKVRKYFTSFTSDDNSFGAAFTPWFETENADFKKSSTVNEYYNIPACFGYLFAYARSIKNNPEWFAVAGSIRGGVPELTDVTYEYTSDETERLQSRASSGAVALGTGLTPFLDGDNVGVAINTISYQGSQFGYLIWGNRTLKTNDVDKRTTATSFLNVRVLASILKKAMFNAARKYTFEPLADVLWFNFKSQITPILDQMQSSQGILGYKFIRQSTTAKARLRAKLVIIPIEGVEDFELTVEFNDTLEVSE